MVPTFIMFELVRPVINRVLNVKCKDTSDFKEDLNANESDITDIIEELEKRFGHSLQPKNSIAFRTVMGLIRYLQNDTLLGIRGVRNLCAVSDSIEKELIKR